MAGVLGKFLEYIGIEENGADDEVYEDVNYEDESRDNNVVNFGNRAKKNVQSESNVVSLPNAAQLKMIVYHPVSYEDTQNIIDNLKSRKLSTWKSWILTAHSVFWTSWPAQYTRSTAPFTKSPAAYSS